MPAGRIVKFTKRTYGKKMRGRRRRVSTRRSGRIRAMHYFSRYSFYQAPLVSFTTNANGQLFGVMFAQGLDSIYTDLAVVSMPNRGEFTSLFDQYKILSYSIELHPRFSSQDLAWAGGANGNYIPTIYWVHDQDDASAPTSMGEVMEHQKVRYAPLNKVVRITVKYPTVRAENYNSALTTGYSPKRAPWIDCNSYQLPHYGIKYAIQGKENFNYTTFYDIRVKWNLAFKNVR